jgi:hypothetical protein
MSRHGVSHVNVTLRDIRRMAESAGLTLETWAPGDGVRRFQFGVPRRGEPHIVERRLYTASGIGEALVYITGWEHGYGLAQQGHISGIRKNPGRTRGGGEEPESVHTGFNKIMVVDSVWKSLRLDRHQRFPSTSELGGYPLYYIVAEPEGKGWKNHADVLPSTLNNDHIGGDDYVIGVEVNWEDENMVDDITGEKIPSAYGGDETENPKTRQVIFKQTGGVAYGKAQHVAFDLRGAGYHAEEGNIQSPAGSFADSVFMMTNAPMPAILKAAKKEGLEIQRSR